MSGRRALADLDEIFDYIAGDDPGAALWWVQQLQGGARTAAEMPMMGRVVPELQQERIREIILRTYPIVYLVSDDAIQVLTVLEGHRLFPHHAIP